MFRLYPPLPELNTRKIRATSIEIANFFICFYLLGLIVADEEPLDKVAKS